MRNDYLVNYFEQVLRDKEFRDYDIDDYLYSFNEVNEFVQVVEDFQALASNTTWENARHEAQELLEKYNN
jgi:RNase adaptor protein for sRNA GlmZ degradation